MFTVHRQPSSFFATSLKPIAGIATAALLIGWAAGVGAQSTNQPPLPPLPPAKQGDATQNNAPPSAQAPTAQQQQVASPASNLPALPLGHDDVREVQNQLIALGFDPGAADGEAGPATVAAAQQYDQSRGGSGQVSIDSALLARLKADTAPRLSYDQVAARSQARSQAQAPASASGASQIGSVVQQLAPLIGAVVNSSNNGNYGGGYGYGGYPGPGYYGPGPVYGGYHYGGY
jgi:peptidoglycan hydrolase-like protein with peptidoglycan-binding domain